MRTARPLWHPISGSGHPLDDDEDLAHIGDFGPPPLEVAPSSDPSEAKAKPHRSGAAIGPMTARHAIAMKKGKDAAPPENKIRTFEQRLGGAGGDSQWSRPAAMSGTGATHVKSFHCKLTGDSLEYLDRQINEWLDEHPEFDIKQVTTAVGEWSGKAREPSLIVNVWV